MRISPNTQAVLLLTAYFSKPKSGEARPLAPKEWGRFAFWLKEQSLNPERLITGDPTKLLSRWRDRQITIERIEALLNRGSALALAAEKWSRAGLWVLTRSDVDYPDRLKCRLKADSPAILFGSGNARLLGKGGVAVVGSRQAPEEALVYARRLGERAAENGMSLVSGGARGVDEAAIAGALEREGTVIGVLADSLLRAATSSRYRSHVMNGNLALISPFYPEAGFNAGNAMARNKHIYCLSDGAVVVHSGTKGGTWNGAMENLKNDWVPLWVRGPQTEVNGNSQLVAKGGSWIPENADRVDIFFLVGNGATTADSASPSGPVVHRSNRVESTGEAAKSPDFHSAGDSNSGAVREPSEPAHVITPAGHERQNLVSGNCDTAGMSKRAGEAGFYDLFLAKLRILCEGKARSPDELAEYMDVSKSQLNVWLKRAVSEGKVEKLNRPVRYRCKDESSEQILMFES